MAPAKNGHFRLALGGESSPLYDTASSGLATKTLPWFSVDDVRVCTAVRPVEVETLLIREHNSRPIRPTLLILCPRLASLNMAWLESLLHLRVDE